jgi:hypothetical protein
MNTNDTHDTPAGDITMEEVLGKPAQPAQAVDKDSADYRAGYKDGETHLMSVRAEESLKDFRERQAVLQIDAADATLVAFDDQLANADYIEDECDGGDPCFSVIDKRTGEGVTANHDVWELINEDDWFYDYGIFQNGRAYCGYATKQNAVNAVVEIRHVIAATRAVLTVKRIYRDARKQNRSGKTEC